MREEERERTLEEWSGGRKRARGDRERERSPGPNKAMGARAGMCPLLL